jgi:hypothetical protein
MDFDAFLACQSSCSPALSTLTPLKWQAKETSTGRTRSLDGCSTVSELSSQPRNIAKYGVKSVASAMSSAMKHVPLAQYASFWAWTVVAMKETSSSILRLALKLELCAFGDHYLPKMNANA